MKLTKEQEKINKNGRIFINERVTAGINSDGDCVPIFSNQDFDDNDPWSVRRKELTEGKK